MTGPEHYRKAEQLLGAADDAAWDATNPDHQAITARLSQDAQVHATSALAAATALGAIREHDGMPYEDESAWLAADPAGGAS